MKKFMSGAGWFNAIIAHAAMKPMMNKHELIKAVHRSSIDGDKAKIGVPLEVIVAAFEKIPMQLEVLRDTGAARVSSRGRLVIDLPIGQLAWKSGYNFRNAKPYLRIWLNGSPIYSEN